MEAFRPSANASSMTPDHLHKGEYETDCTLPASCMVCLQPLTTRNHMQMQPCGHLFCVQCVTDFLELKVSSRGVKSLSCPAFNCSTVLSDDEVKQRIGEEKFAKYMRFVIESELEADPDFRWCPRVTCTGYDYCRGLKRKLVCNRCGFMYCRYCLLEWHGRRKCVAEIDHQFEKWAHGAKVKFCPHCRMRVEKNMGCPHMTCARCSHEWCWACGAPYSGHYPCPVLHPHWANQRWSKCLFALFLPVLFTLVFVIAVLVSMKSLIFNSSINIGIRAVLAMIATTFAVALTPVGFGFAIPLSGIAFLIFCYDKCGCQDCGCCMSFCMLLISLPLGLCLSPFVTAFVFLIVAMGPPVGFVMILLKLGVILVRCSKKDFLKARGIPGYPIG